MYKFAGEIPQETSKQVFCNIKTPLRWRSYQGTSKVPGEEQIGYRYSLQDGLIVICDRYVDSTPFGSAMLEDVVKKDQSW